MTNLSFNETRRKNVTATDMATLFGLNPYESPAKLLDKKLNPVVLDSIHLRRGKLREPSVLEAFLLDLDMETVRHIGPTLEYKHARIAATPDAYLADGSAIVEAKSVLSHNFVKWYESPPLYYIMQVHTQMLVTGLEVGYIGGLEEGDPMESLFRFIAWKVLPSEEIYNLMKIETTRFWDCVESDKLFRVNSKIKKEMLELLNKNMERIYPIEIPVEELERKENELQSLLALFK